MSKGLYGPVVKWSSDLSFDMEDLCNNFKEDMVCLIELLRLMMLRLCRFKSVMNLQLSMKERMIPANLRSLEMS